MRSKTHVLKLRGLPNNEMDRCSLSEREVALRVIDRVNIPCPMHNRLCRLDVKMTSYLTSTVKFHDRYFSGYNTSKIASFEVRAEQDQHTPIRYMLLEWGKSDSATVGVLVHALRHIGRRDIAKVLAGNRDSLLSNDKESV